MKLVALFFVLMVCSLIFSLTANSSDMGIFLSRHTQGGHRNANRNGEAAVGVLVNEDKANKMLMLDVTPCRKREEPSMIITFHKNYKKKTLGQLSCFDGTTYEAIQVVQRKLN